MNVAQTVVSAREAATALPRPMAFVPTMGALHAGHLRLIEAARKDARSIVVSAFVNPLQFGAGEDLERYPRDVEGDLQKLIGADVDLAFIPSTHGMYGAEYSTFVDVGAIASTYEGAVRPTHFRGVATVVLKLLHIIAPDVVVLGQKDAQQTAVLRKMVRELDVPVRVAIVPTVREDDGLALSSRNAYLSRVQRAAASSLYRALCAMAASLREGVGAPQARQDAMRILQSPGEWDYLDVVDMENFLPLQSLQEPAFVIGAARFGDTRLIDNLMFPSPGVA